MIDPKLVIVILAVAAAVWLGEQVVKGTKYVGHKAKCGVMKVVGKDCKPANPMLIGPKAPISR